MASGKLLRQLIKYGARGDVVAFRAAAEAAISEEREKQHHLLANDLERLLYADHMSLDSRLKELHPAGRQHHVARLQVSVELARGVNGSDPRDQLRQPRAQAILIELAFGVAAFSRAVRRSSPVRSATSA